MKSTELRYRLIVFDWDGTLFDSTAQIVRAIQAAVRDVGGRVPSDEQAAWVIGMGLMQALAHVAPDVPPERYPLLGQRYQQHYLAQQHELTLFDGVLPLLAELRALIEKTTPANLPAAVDALFARREQECLASGEA